MKIYKPIIKTFTFSEYNNNWVRFDVELSTGIVSWIKIYSGRLFVVNNSVSMNLDDILKSIQYETIFNYDSSTQSYKPGNLQSSLPVTGLLPIEYESKLVNTNIRITFKDENNTSLLVDRFPVNIFYNDVSVPYGNIVNDKGVFTDNIVVNHVPFLLTNNYWIELNYWTTGTDKGQLVANTQYETITQNITNTGKQGNYSVSFTLNTIFNKFTTTSNYHLLIGDGDAEDFIIGGTATPLTDKYVGINDTNNEELQDVKTISFGDSLIVEVDACPKNYYMCWTDVYGWHSIPVKLNSSVYNTSKSITFDIYRQSNVIGLTRNHVFDLVTYGVNNEQYHTLVDGLSGTKYVYLYDSKNDVGHLTYIDTSNFTEIRNNKYKQLGLSLVKI
jgi:hypothetical protein